MTATVKPANTIVCRVCNFTIITDERFGVYCPNCHVYNSTTTKPLPSHDFSTIDIEMLRSLPVYKLPPTYQLQDRPGSGCAGDPPGYPTYFTRNIYNATGNSPRNAPSLVIVDPFTSKLHIVQDGRKGVKSWDDLHASTNRLMHKLYKPLPIDHPRVQAWIASTMTHTAHCYVDDKAIVAPFEYGKPATVIFPVPNYKLATFVDDPRFSDEWRSKTKDEINVFNAKLIANTAKLATVDNHKGVRVIREFYPNFMQSPTPEGIYANSKAFRRDQTSMLEMLENIGHAVDGVPLGDWWERYAIPFTADNCPGLRGKGMSGEHRNDGWCQMCGLVNNEIVKDDGSVVRS